MTLFARLVLLLWLPVGIWIFRRYDTRTAILITAISGTLFLPQRVRFPLPLIPDYESSTAVVYVILIGLFLYDTKWLTRLQPWWLDVPIFFWCISPLFASIRNDLGIYDGVNATFITIWQYGIPYLLGRVYFNNLENLKKLAVAIVKGGLIYVPFCIWEGLMSPQLHRQLYGYYAHSSGIRQSIRFGGYRPMVFMTHGLAVGLFMMTVTLIALWLWQSKGVREIWGFDLIYIVPVLVFTLVWCRSTGALALFLYGVIILVVAKWGKSSWPLWILIFGIIIYLYLNIQGIFDKTPVLEFANNFVPAQRIQSLEFRLDEEELLAAKAREQFWFGWGGWGRNRIYEENFYGIFEDTSITDSLWILAFGTRGIIGIVSITASMLLPTMVFAAFSYQVRTWFHPRVCAAAVFAVLLPLFMLDSLLNSHLTIIAWVIPGALTGLILNEEEQLTTIKSENELESLYLAKISENIAKK